MRRNEGLSALRISSAVAVGGMVRRITRRSPDLIAKALLHLHRPLIGHYQVLINHGGFRIFVNPQDNCGGSLYYRGSYEPQETRYFLQLIEAEQPDLFVDVGANIGYYCLTAASRGVSRVIAFEPSPTIADVLTRSVQANDTLRDRVQIRREALSDHPGVIKFWPNLQEHNFGTGSVVPLEIPSENRCIEVRCHKGDDALSGVGQGRLLIKMDIEGGEFAALQGLRETILKLKPTLLMEVHPNQLRALGHDPDALLLLLRNLGYGICRLIGGAEMDLPSGRPYGSEVGWIVARRLEDPDVSGAFEG